MKNLAIALGLVLALARPAVATVIEVPVPELVGTHSCAHTNESWCSQNVAIHLPVIPAVIHSVSLRIEGTASFATFSCGTSGPPFVVPTTLVAYLHDPGVFQGDLWWALHSNAASGPIAYTQPFEVQQGTWAFLLDGTATLEFFLDATGSIDDCDLAGPRDSTTLTSATLLVDGDLPTPTARRSWGHLKAIYR